METLHDSLRKGRRPKKIDKVCLTPISFSLLEMELTLSGINEARFSLRLKPC